MAKKNTQTRRNDMEFDRVIDNIRLTRQTNFPEEKLRIKTPARITLAITRHRLFPQIKKDIVDADLR